LADSFSRAAPILPTSSASDARPAWLAQFFILGWVKTGDAQAILGDTVRLRDAVQRWGNLGGSSRALHK
jgi:hypothetical protein